MVSEQKVSPGSRAGLFTYFLIAFGIPWGGWIAVRLVQMPGPALQALAYIWLPAAVSIAGFAAAFADGGVPGLRTFIRRVISMRFSPWYWLVALALPFVAGALTFTPHPADLLRDWHPLWARLWVPVTLVNFWTGPLAEEFGWRGYLLQRLGKRLSPLGSGLCIGLIWALWHVPLFYDSVYAHLSSALGFVAWITAWSVVMALVVTRCRGSVLPSILIHFLINNQAGLFAALMPALPHDGLPGGPAFSLSSAVVAVGLAWAWRKSAVLPPSLAEDGARRAST